MANRSPDKKSGCGLLNAVFGRRWSRRTTSTGSIPIINSKEEFVKMPSFNSKRRRNSTDESTLMENQPENFLETSQKPVAKPPSTTQKQLKPPQQPPRKAPEYEQKTTSKAQANHMGYVNNGRRVPKEAVGISGELESMIVEQQRARGGGGNANLIRASSSNMMLAGNLGNLKTGGGGKENLYDQLDSYLPKPREQEMSKTSPSSSAGKANNNKYSNSVMGNVVKTKQNNDQQESYKPKPEENSSLCRALSTRMDPEQLKIMGNEDYKMGNFAEALALYDAAIAIDPNKASYRSNKSAALTALGRILEAVFECREAIRIEPHYHRAHHRLANLYLKLGEVEKAIYHYKHAGPEADQVDIAKAKSVQVHLNKCTEAKRLRDWNTLIKVTASAISAGADAAPQIFALQAEALLKLQRHQDADEAMKNGSNFDVDDCTRFFGPIANANLLVVKAQVNLAMGRFEDALEAIQKAAKLDTNNKEANIVMRKARAVAAARSKGNELFKGGNFADACVAYGEGLDHDRYNSVLLCNRAACRSKLGQFEKAIEDCNAALHLCPNYNKARLRRADCNAKLERWEASVQDYEILKQENPEDEEVNKALLEAQTQLKKQRGGP
ncbi:inactive TPR repeat-containing thioredoxin TTL3-like [Mangifera indica]|uniref:inactive TPR repeat-containing thioredoxin TTL3-like n=1 Tax=Mangifera indica TaxID=29780 RepID=UPI001CFA9DDD|nr:inactive TPR repeat-containing thioredoxin TTL3-like [Mangifera indica]